MVDYSKAIFENSNDAMLVHNSDTAILDANNAAGELLEYKREDLIVLRISDFSEIHRPMSERNKAEPMIQGHTIFDRVVVERTAPASRSRYQIRS